MQNLHSPTGSVNRALNINPKFRDICRPLTDAEKELLHRDLLGRGMLNPIIVWQGKDIIVDGHNRYAWATQNKQPFEVREEFFADEDSVLEFIIQNQLGRRNIDSKTRDYLQGELLETRKRMDAKFVKGECPNPAGRAGKEQERNSCAPVSDGKTAAAIAKQMGVSTRTVEGNGQFARAVNKLGIKEAVIAGKEKRSKKEIVAEAEGKTAENAEPVKRTVEQLQQLAVRRWKNFIKDLSEDEIDQVVAFINQQIQKGGQE